MPSPSRRSLLAALPAVGLAALAGAPPAAASAGAVLPALTRAARPLRTTRPDGDLADLRPLGAAIGRTPVVGLGEVAHGAHELYALKHRVFRYLVEELGFRVFVLETSWTSGLLLNAYVRDGRGDPRAIMAAEFGGGAWPWGVHEYLDLLRWMRAYNVRHPGDPVTFAGNDTAHPRLPGWLFDRVTGYAERRRPGLARELAGRYGGLRAHPATEELLALPQPERRRLAADARRAHQLLAEAGPDRREPEAFAWAVQHARVLAQTATLLAYDLTDPAEIPESMRYRDELMAENTAWWHRHTGQKVLLSAHAGHTGYETYVPDLYPVTQGAFLRQLLGPDYLSLGTTFGQGATTEPDDSTGEWVTHRFGPPREGSSEHTLDQVPHHLYLLDPRETEPPARRWLHRTRPTRDVGPPGGAYYPYSLAAGHDLLIHVSTLRPAVPLAGA
ncbi:erythromycin esterase family protein [Streptomyces sp. 7-21]|uniref:erythromycin esterase family protein n=1 Tax=Streptomyces sp. 7-21 TaxID=2802283 RepID=UPI00191EF278|nr:erythromycin esterase family protein [Streptomyces sp. 7-21]MBL1066884.1 erythromycin esterase family protein [Streptomyces sp. 7-21]